MEERIPFKEIEPKWQKFWAESGLFKTTMDSDKPKFYLLEMYPYPSGDLHMGHVRNYTIGEATARYKRMKGYNVLYPMGFDSFGMPSEAAAIKNKMHPKIWTYKCIEKMRTALTRLGQSYDWNREVVTCAPEYYKWNQWIFLKMLEKGLAYKKLSAVNWCPKCQTVLANEQVEDGKCWRCSETVTQKELEQWFLKITDYADQLIDDLDKLPGWSERAKSLQRNWIGKSTGIEIDFPILEGQGIKTKSFTVFTTRPDTIYGATYCVLSPEHPLVDEIIKVSPDAANIKAFVDRVKNQDRTVETLLELPKEGLDTGIKAINPVNKEPISIFLANYVLMEYGTGAIMAVPTHDQRDFEFAQKYGIKMILVIDKPDNPLQLNEMTVAYEDSGVMVNSGEFNGLTSGEAWDKIADKMVSEGYARRTVNFRIRDWGISRQRFWGTPIPIIYCSDCGTVPVPEKDLPVLLPDNVDFSDYSGSPLKKLSEFVDCPCPKCGKPAKRDTDTMDGFIDSSWYFLRYTTHPDRREPAAFNVEDAKFWLPANLYIGGIDHATKHLIYSRFFVKFLRDIGLVNIDEPFTNLINQGWVLGTDGQKMSKSKGNVVDPNKLLQEYGADTMRICMMFIAPPEPDMAWSDEGIEGAHRFLNRVWRIALQHCDAVSSNLYPKLDGIELSENARSLHKATHKAIKKVSEDIEDRLHFNTAIAAMMELVNELYKFDSSKIDPSEAKLVLSEALSNLVLLISPLAPHLAEELWHRFGYKDSVFAEKWPEYNPSVLIDNAVEIVLQVNGKVRSRLVVPIDATKEQIQEIALSDQRIIQLLDGKQPKKVIVIPQKLVNIVV